MTSVSVGRLAGTRRIVLALLVVTLGALGAASPALAVEHHPKGLFAPFKDCPLSNSAVEECVFAKTTSGEFVAGNSNVPITNPVTLQGGTSENAEGEQKFYGAEDGNTLSKSPQKVPGGLAGLIRCNEIANILERIACELVFENGATGVNATTELAAPASSIGINTSNLAVGEGMALTLPVKVHLENPLLGSTCYIGSNSKPIVIVFTTGTTSPPPPNKPITGKPGEGEILEEGALFRIHNNSLVNNSFAAPGVTGCGGIGVELILDPLINAKLALPAAAGHNTAILNGTVEQAAALAVKRSE
jgi:hypothetical protein